MTTAFTPGPWHYQEDSDVYTHIVRGPENQFLASAPQSTALVTEANVRLMSAAPDLYAALKDIRMNNAGSKERRRGWANALAALAKAEGVQP